MPVVHSLFKQLKQKIYNLFTILKSGAARPSPRRAQRKGALLGRPLLYDTQILIRCREAAKRAHANTLNVRNFCDVDIPAVLLKDADSHILVILLQFCNQFLNSHM